MYRWFLFALASLGFVSIPAVASGEGLHTVQKGQSLWTIARKYGCAVSQLKQVNRLRGELILPGQKLKVPACRSARTGTSGRSRGGAGGSVLDYVVEKGDTLGGIARHYDTTVDDIMGRNGLDDHIIYPGQKLRVAPGVDAAERPIRGQSVGLPHRGKLVGGLRFTSGRGWHIRRPKLSWGANHAVHHIKNVIREVRSEHDVHVLAIGDLSAKNGGKIPLHRSHQSGRDADIGFYFRQKPRDYPKEFVRATRKNLDFPAMWAMIKGFADTHRLDHGVEVMFLNYAVQAYLYDWAKKNGADKGELDRIFQYPHGKWARRGLIRHEPGHLAHIHVRFKCPANDSKCE